MKKFVSFILCAILLVCGTIALVGCNKNNNVIDLSTLSEGDEIPVYPGCEFDYKCINRQTETEHVIHISSVKAEFVKANVIEEGFMIEDSFYPYECKITVSGKTDSVLANKKIAISFVDENKAKVSLFCQIDDNGNFSETAIFGYYTSIFTKLSFFNIQIT